MKKLLIIPMMALIIILCSCEMGGGGGAKKLTVKYYDGTTLLKSEEYEDTINLYEYTKEDFEFKGWYLDQDLSKPFDKNNQSQYFKQATLDLYARMEKIVKDFNIKIQGQKDNELVVLNPVFTWENLKGDATYKVTLLSDGEKVAEVSGNGNRYQYASMLQPNTNYKLVVLGEQSNLECSVTFTTAASTDAIYVGITIGNPYMDGMVIQRNVENIVCGTAPAGQLIMVQVNGQEFYGTSDASGNYEVVMEAQPENFEATTLTVTNGMGASKTLNNVLFGDVYLFAGQSNMQWQTMNSDYTDIDMQKLLASSVRFFCQDVTTSSVKMDAVKNGRWFAPTETNVMNFSAIATITGALLGSSLKTEAPIGIVTAYQGDTNIANWMGPEYYNGTCQTKYLHYNAMVYPLRHTKLSGVVWYQGCNNSAAGCEYKDLLLDLFQNYRDLFNTEQLPFFVIGLACYDGDSGNNFDFSYVRESQAKACAEDDNAYFISTCDDGDPTYIHPRAKHYICERVYKSISSVVYGRNYYAEGPTYKSHSVNGNKVTVEFYNNLGLNATGEIKGFYLAGEDGKYYEATAVISNEKIIAFTSKVQNPVYIKYGFGKSPFVNIFNKDGFAITPFRTDEYNTNIDLFDYNGTANYTFHPDGSTMQVSITNQNNLQIKKLADGKTYGSVRLNYWGSVSYMPEGFRMTVKGTNSGASIAMRFIEGGSYEIWAYKFVDDFEGERTFTISAGDLTCVYNKQNNIFEPQKIAYIELMIEKNGDATIEIEEARFIHLERSKPMSFIISNVTELDDKVNVTISQALFATTYHMMLTTGATTVFDRTQEELTFSIDKSLLQKGVPYYIDVEASNELGATAATNSGFVFYLKDESRVIVCNFDFKDQASLSAYIDSSMSVHAGLTTTLEAEGVKITSSGAGWQQFIFKLDTGAGAGMSKLQFKADFSNYHGTVVMQLADTSWGTYTYNLDIVSQPNGTYTIDFSSFVNGSTPFTTQNLMWVMFNFNDNTGNGYILLDDVVLLK